MTALSFVVLASCWLAFCGALSRAAVLEPTRAPSLPSGHASHVWVGTVGTTAFCGAVPLLAGLVQGTDYIGFNQSAWDVLHDIYGGGPQLCAPSCDIYSVQLQVQAGTAGEDGDDHGEDHADDSAMHDAVSSGSDEANPLSRPALSPLPSVASLASESSSTTTAGAGTGSPSSLLAATEAAAAAAGVKTVQADLTVPDPAAADTVLAEGRQQPPEDEGLGRDKQPKERSREERREARRRKKKKRKQRRRRLERDDAAYQAMCREEERKLISGASARGVACLTVAGMPLASTLGAGGRATVGDQNRAFAPRVVAPARGHGLRSGTQQRHGRDPT